MRTAGLCLVAGLGLACTRLTAGGDPRLREVVYDPHQVVTVPVRRGIATLVVLGADEHIQEVGTGLGADCAKADSTWCVAVQPGGRTLFVKPRRAADAPNNLAVVTDKRVHSLRFLVLAEDDPKPPVYRLSVNAPVAMPPATPAPAPQVLPVLRAAAPLPAQEVAERLRAGPRPLNSLYSLAEGKDSQDIVPTLVFDDGRFTYLRFPGNREVPAVFQVLGDGTESLVNLRMEEDLLVVDRVCRRLVLRAGSAVVGLWNDAFAPEGVPPLEGTTAPGVRRVVRAGDAAGLNGSTGEAP